MNRLALTFALVLPTMVACGGGQKTEEGQLTPGGPVVEYPEWVNKGSGAFGGEKKILYGVGSASGIRNHSLARTTADNRARAEISKIFEVYSASLMKDFQESVTAGDFSASDESQLVSQAIKTFSANTLNGVEVVDHWIHPVDGTIYALARLDMDGFGDMLSQQKELNAKVREKVKRAAEKAFADLEAEEAKHTDQ
ncbi:MAG: LPP20 family lipoprotein [Deltaproteobacteria bacterium]|nr:LPP20 family lipoprotein [Deltaproteobacteria bacterium]